MAELRRRLEELAGRGEPRGAVRVWDDATTGRASAGGIRRQPAVAFLAMVTIAALVASGIANIGAGSGGNPSLIASSRLDSFAGCDALLAHLRTEALERVGPYGLSGTSGIAVAVEDRAAVPERFAPGATAEVGSGTGEDAAEPFSSTNVQEPGVDEPDLVKTDGRVVYALANGRLWAVAERGTAELLGSIAMASGQQLLLAGDRLLVIGVGSTVEPMASSSSSAARGGIASDMPVLARSGVTLTVVDVRQPAAMTVTSTVEVDGRYVSARLVDGVARIVIGSSGPDLPFVYPASGSEAALQRATAANREVVSSSTIGDWLPSYRSDGGSGRPAYDCRRTFAPREFSGFGLLTLLTFDPAHPGIDDSTSVLADGDTVYSSAEHLYVATNRWQGDGGIEPAVGRLAPSSAPAPGGQLHTLIHEFDIRGDGPARYLVSGEVRGTVLSQFSMSEHRGDLRVATTDAVADGSGTESFVTVLTDDGESLRQVGQVGGLGKGEQIRGVRFVGDRGYVVTFRQTDPLYVLDLGDPAAPAVTGELKVLGFSAYLHPLDGHLLIGVGADATEQGRITGTQVSLFDVSDPANPTRLQQQVIAASETAAAFDHHAFLYWPATGLTVLPIQEYGGRRPLGSTAPQAYALGLRVTADGIARVGQVQHPALGGSQVGTSDPVLRSLVIGDRLVTFSSAGVLSSDLATLAPGAWVPLS